MIETIAFYLFSAVLVASAIMVVFSKNPVHSVLFLILAFFNAAGLFILLGAEFVAMILVIVYVGAVAVLFLFVVMMLDINFADFRKGINTYLPFGIFLGLVLGIELVFLVFQTLGRAAGGAGPSPAPTPLPTQITNTRALGQLLYTHYLYIFQVAGLILLVAMIGAIVLTLRRRGGVQRQRIAVQNARRRGEVLAIKQVPSGTGSTRPMIGLWNYLFVGALVFVLGVLGIFLNRKNVIIILMSIELILLSVNINFVAFSAYLGDLFGQVFVMFVLTVAAAESAIGLAILMVYFRNRGSIAVEDVNTMKG